MATTHNRALGKILVAALAGGLGCSSSRPCPVCPVATAPDASVDAGAPEGDAATRPVLFDWARAPRPKFASACERALSLGKTSATERAVFAINQRFGPKGVNKIVDDVVEAANHRNPKVRAAFRALLVRMSQDPSAPGDAWVHIESNSTASAGADELRGFPEPDGRAVVRLDGDAAARCAEHGGGAWLTVDVEVPTGNCTIRSTHEGRAEVVVEMVGLSGVAYVPLEGLVVAYWRSPKSPSTVQASDLDGDGIPEGIFHYEFSNEGSTDYCFWFTTVKRGKAGPYQLVVRNGVNRYRPEPANEYVSIEGLQLIGVEDKTGDGRLDLVLGAIACETSCGSGFCGEQVALTLVAEGLADGTFDLQTPAAIAHARRQCPSRPSRYPNARSIACGKLWGVTEREIARATGLDRGPKRCPEGTVKDTLLSTMLEITLPFRFADVEPR